MDIIIIIIIIIAFFLSFSLGNFHVQYYYFSLLLLFIIFVIPFFPSFLLSTGHKQTLLLLLSLFFPSFLLSLQVISTCRPTRQTNSRTTLTLLMWSMKYVLARNSTIQTLLGSSTHYIYALRWMAIVSWAEFVFVSVSVNVIVCKLDDSCKFSVL